MQMVTNNKLCKIIPECRFLFTKLSYKLVSYWLCSNSFRLNINKNTFPFLPYHNLFFIFVCITYKVKQIISWSRYYYHQYMWSILISLLNKACFNKISYFPFEGMGRFKKQKYKMSQSKAIALDSCNQT